MRAKRVHQLRKENGLTKDDKGKMREIKKLWNMLVCMRDGKITRQSGILETLQMVEQDLKGNLLGTHYEHKQIE